MSDAAAAKPVKSKEQLWHERDQLSPVWDWSQERVFNEQLLNQRFQFMQVLFSACLFGAIHVKKQAHLLGVLLVGAVFVTLLAWTVFRTARVVDRIFDQLKKTGGHPVAELGTAPKRWYASRPIIGTYIPCLCSGILWLAFVAAAASWWEV